MCIEQLETALHSRNPAEALREVVRTLASEGTTKASIYEKLEQLLVELRERASHSESDENTVLDVMDTLTGWCDPAARLLPD
jgi:hypothetical protein